MSASIQSPHFLARRIHSLLGVIPIGGFLMFHLWENSQSRKGAPHFNEIVSKLEDLNYVLLIEIFVLGLPILAHALYGLWIWWKGRANVVRYGFFRNWMYWIQRISGIGVLLFLIVHVGGTRIRKEFIELDPDDGLFGLMRDMLENPAYFAFYVIGLVLAVAHLCNGLWTFAIAWGITTTPRSQKISFAVCSALFVVLSLMGVHSLLGFLIDVDFI